MAITFLCLKTSNNYEENPFAVLVKTGKNNQVIELYKDEMGESYFIFLPSYADEKNTRIRILTTLPVYLDDTKLKEGSDFEDINFDHPYSLKVGDNELGTVSFMHSSNIASVFITTSKRDLSLLSSDKNAFDTGEISIIDETGDVEYSGELKSISGRGNQSWFFDKKPWSIHLPREVGLLGMRNSDKWNLIANLCDDTDGLRNMAAHYMAAQANMEFVSQQRFIDLYINSTYYGIYQLVEKTEEKQDKLDIGDLDLENLFVNGRVLDVETIERYTEYGEDELPAFSYSMNVKSPEDISGGYIIERNYGYKLEEKPHLFTSSRNETFVVRYPSVVNKEELNYICSIVQNFEDALFDDDYRNPETGKGVWELADLDSFVKKFLVEETSKNSGAAVTSSYYYKKRGDDKLYAGPVWDFDKSFGNYYVWENYEGLSLGLLHDDVKTFWYEKIYENEEARDLIEKYYADLIRPSVKEITGTLIDEWADQIRDSYNMNSTRWHYLLKNDPDYYKQLGLQYCFDLNEAAGYLKDWTNSRLAYLDKIWLDED